MKNYFINTVYCEHLTSKIEVLSLPFQVYLARTETASTGHITWQIDLNSCDLVIDSVTIIARSDTFQTGRVDWKLSGDEESQVEMLSGGVCSRYVIYESAQ